MSPVTRRPLRISQIAAALLATACLAGAATAQPLTREDRAYSAQFHACMDASGDGDFAMRDCVNAERERWDAQLNRVYRSLMARASPGDRRALRLQERAWLRTTRVRCDHAGDENEGGTLQPLQIDDCYLQATTGRTLDLQGRR
jgi:uncharacterized protein YecT (DUF1311 family)